MRLTHAGTKGGGAVDFFTQGMLFSIGICHHLRGRVPGMSLDHASSIRLEEGVPNRLIVV